MNGKRCPSLTVKTNPDPLRRDPVAYVDNSCVGCGVCGEVAHAAVLCPSFYRADVIYNPTAWERLLHSIRNAVIGTLPENHAAVWEDEADIDLNPRIGFDWMLPGRQRRVMTPGKNVKRHLAGAMDAKTDKVMWVRGERKNSRLFIDLLKKLLSTYANKRMIHVILDNYTIHTSRQTRLWLSEFGHKFRLHFLPPYCPDDNRIERKVWREMHANVTVNHRCEDIDELMAEAVYYLMSHNRRAQSGVRELRKAI